MVGKLYLYREVESGINNTLDYHTEKEQRLTDTTKAAAAKLAALARRIVEAGRSQYEAMPAEAQKRQVYVWRAQMVAQTGCHRHTATKHIERAIAQQPPPTWGRPAAGEPAEE